MALSEKTPEIRRLISAFESESLKFHALRLSLIRLANGISDTHRVFVKPNHAIMLWQYYGALADESAVAHLMKNLSASDLTWGIRGAELTCFGLLEGDGCDLFVRMARRAGALFDESEALTLQTRSTNEIIEGEQRRTNLSKPMVASNNDPLAVWLNYLLFHISLTNPGRERAAQIQPDPFSLSLMALERLALEKSVTKSDRSARSVDSIEFRVALSFPGVCRGFVSVVADRLRQQMPPDSVFYDFDYQAQLARSNLDILLQDIYKNRSKLVVVFLHEKYAESEWCGLEWRAVRELIKTKKDEQVMFIRFDDATIDGMLSVDGYLDASQFTPEQIAGYIYQRLQAIES